MAKKKTTAPAEPEETTTTTEEAQATEETTEKAQEETQTTEETAQTQEEAHLYPAQFENWDDAGIQKLAQDMGLDPAAYADRDALIAAIVDVPVIPGPSEPQPLTAETPLPCTATVAAPLAVLRKTVGPGTAQQLKPVATLKQGTQVTVKALDGEDALLANGLWTRADFLTV